MLQQRGQRHQCKRSRYWDFINANGVVTGISQDGAINPITGLLEFDTVVWKDGQIINLGTFGGNWSYANATNNRGQVAGFALNTTPDSITTDVLATGNGSSGARATPPSPRS